MAIRQIITVALGMAFATGAVNAKSVDQRHANEQRRIDNGIASGRVTRGEAYRVERQQASIDAQEARIRARNGGHLSPYQRRRLQQRESNASRHIYRAKHN
jgi:hypothetical protein